MLFYEHLYDYPGNTNSLMETLGKQLSYISEDLGLAKMDIEINLPPIFCERFPYTFKDTIFQTGKELDPVPVSTDFTTAQDGLVTITAYSEKDFNWTRDQISEIIFLNEQIMVLINRSRLMSQLKKAEETDHVTNHLNLAGIMHVGELLTIKHVLPQFSVLYLNIIKFSAIDEKFGHANGDLILKSFATDISELLSKDGVVGRTAADNFIIITKSAKVEKILDYLKNYSVIVELDDMSMAKIKIPTKIGICAGTKSTYFPQLIANASVALKKANNLTPFVHFSEN